MEASVLKVVCLKRLSVTGLDVNISPDYRGSLFRDTIDIRYTLFLHFLPACHPLPAAATITMGEITI